MFAVQPGVGHYSNQTPINAGSKLRLPFKLFSGPILKAGVGPLARYSSHQETQSKGPEQMYTPSNTRLEWLGEGP